MDELRTIPGVGPKIAGMLRNLGIRSVRDLRGADPETLYEQACLRAGVRIDRCLLYTFRCAVYFAEEEDPDPELLKWWNWKDVKGEVVPLEGKPFSRALLDWYGREARDLPWRRDPSPYRTWISEMMLQQTRVDTALPYYLRFIGEVPGVKELAALDEERLLKLWQGLGYYNRARNLRKAAEILVRERDGKLPETLKELTALPGIGTYSGGAIASIAFGERVPAIDGNVLRVFARLLGDERDIAGKLFREDADAIVRKLLPEERVGDFNQALMELGALVCLPNAEPLCGSCPVSPFCRAAAEGRTGEIPVKGAAKKRRVERRTILVLVRDNRVALRKRPPNGLLRGLWEFPNLEGWLGTEECRRLLQEMGVEPLDFEELPPAKHVFSHVEWQMRGWKVRVGKDGDGAQGLVWTGKEDLEGGYSIPSAYRAYLNSLELR